MLYEVITDGAGHMGRSEGGAVDRGEGGREETAEGGVGGAHVIARRNQGRIDTTVAA